MKRKFTAYPIQDFTATRTKMLSWAKQFDVFCFLDNHQYNFSGPSFECLLAVTAVETLNLPTGQALASLQKFRESHEDWMFGHLCYDVKNEIEELTSGNHDHIQFPDLFFFIPRAILILTKYELRVGVMGANADEIITELAQAPQIIEDVPTIAPLLVSRFSQSEYISTVKKLQEHILRGDCYEINFCQEFYAPDALIDPLSVYQKLSSASPNPFSALYKARSRYLLCASPERYIKKVADKIYSQPIKGTSRRQLNNPLEDDISRSSLLHNEKERAENVMIVDLVRNDLSKICLEGSVTVEELFGIYSFPQVHQMISTISGTLKADVGIANIFRATFPMGSMTGAPKKKVMELIEMYERTKRGIFSGTLGYINPDGDFDFNVVIRSIMYNAEDRYLSLQAGSAITFISDPAKEYEECLMKMEAMKCALQ